MIPFHPEAVLLDRDGTINVKAPHGEYVTSPRQLELLPGAAAAIRTLNRLCVPVIVVTNQRGIALGRMTEDDLAAVHGRLHDLLYDQGARVDQVLYCPHDKGVCECRKPGTLLLERARNHLALASLEHSVMIGDSPSDAAAGLAAGARAVLISRDGTADLNRTGVEVAVSLLEAVHLSLRLPAAKMNRSSARLCSCLP